MTNREISISIPDVDKKPIQEIRPTYDIPYDCINYEGVDSIVVETLYDGMTVYVIWSWNPNSYHPDYRNDDGHYDQCEGVFFYKDLAMKWAKGEMTEIMPKCIYEFEREMELRKMFN